VTPDFITTVLSQLDVVELETILRNKQSESWFEITGEDAFDKLAKTLGRVMSVHNAVICVKAMVNKLARLEGASRQQVIRQDRANVYRPFQFSIDKAWRELGKDAYVAIPANFYERWDPVIASDIIGLINELEIDVVESPPIDPGTMISTQRDLLDFLRALIDEVQTFRRIKHVKFDSESNSGPNFYSKCGRNMARVLYIREILNQLQVPASMRCKIEVDIPARNGDKTYSGKTMLTRMLETIVSRRSDCASLGPFVERLILSRIKQVVQRYLSNDELRINRIINTQPFVKSLSGLQSELKPTRTISEVIPMNERKKGKNAPTHRDKLVKVKDSIYASKHPMLFDVERPLVKTIYEQSWIQCKSAMKELEQRLDAFHNDKLPLISFDPEIMDLIKKIKFLQHMKQKVRDAATKQFGARNKLFGIANKQTRVSTFRNLRNLIDFMCPNGDFVMAKVNQLNMEISQMKQAEKLMNNFLSQKLGFLQVEITLPDGTTLKSESPEHIHQVFSNRLDDIEPIYSSQRQKLDKYINLVDVCSRAIHQKLENMNMPQEVRRPNVADVPPPDVPRREG